MTWRQSSRTVRDYCDRMELGSATTPAGRKVGIDGHIVFGKEFDKYGDFRIVRHSAGKCIR